MFKSLPSEIVLRILSYFSIKELQLFYSVSKLWNDFMITNEPSVYHGAASLHNFVSSSNRPLEDALTANPGPWMNNMGGWKDYCQRFFRLHQNWSGDGELPVPRERLYRSTREVHRFKLDERLRLIITTHRHGGLRVLSMDTDVILFELSKTYVRPYAHCEYENGYLIFDRRDPHSLEVWKFDAAQPVTENPDFPPDARQIAAFEEAIASMHNPLRRGILRPHALLIPPTHPRAYRYVHPTLLIGSEIGQALYLYDIPSSSLLESIPLPLLGPSVDTHGNFSSTGGPIKIHYVELGPAHAFVACGSSVLVLARNFVQTPEHRRVLDFPRSMDGDAAPGLSMPALARHDAYKFFSPFAPRGGVMKCQLVPPNRGTSNALVPLRDDPHQFCGVHISPDGKSFAAITWSGLLFLVYDFERVFPSSQQGGRQKKFTDPDVTWSIYLHSPVTNLAFGDDGRLVMQSFHSIYIFEWPASAPLAPTLTATSSEYCPQEGTNSSSLTVTSDPASPFFNLHMYQLIDFQLDLALTLVSCVKITRTSVWLDWSAKALVDGRNVGRSGAGDRIEVYADPHIDEVAEEEEEEEAAMDDDEDDEVWEEDHAWEDDDNPYRRRILCQVDFSPKTHS